MPEHRHPIVSNSAADRAGQAIRDFLNLPEDERAKAAVRSAVFLHIATVDNYRAMHGYPMTRVTMGIRSMLWTETHDEEIRPGQRFKRFERIINKLLRYPRMRLSQMEDIGGCRAVVNDLDQLGRVLARVRRRWPHAQITDYVAEPKADGYRGVHIIEKRDRRQIEVQLRTIGQHRWAETIELYAPRLGFNLKDGEGPADLREYFKVAADRIAAAELGEPFDAAAEAAFATLRQRVVPYFRRNT